MAEGPDVHPAVWVGGALFETEIRTSVQATADVVPHRARRRTGLGGRSRPLHNATLKVLNQDLVLDQRFRDRMAPTPQAARSLVVMQKPSRAGNAVKSNGQVGNVVAQGRIELDAAHRDTSKSRQGANPAGQDGWESDGRGCQDRSATDPAARRR